MTYITALPEFVFLNEALTYPASRRESISPFDNATPRAFSMSGMVTGWLKAM